MAAMTMVQAIQKYHPQFTDAQLNDRDFLVSELQDLKAKYRTSDGVGPFCSRVALPLNWNVPRTVWKVPPWGWKWFICWFWKS